MDSTTNYIPPVNLLKSCYPSYLTPPGSPTDVSISSDQYPSCTPVEVKSQVVHHAGVVVPHNEPFGLIQELAVCNDEELIRMTDDFSSILNRALTPPATSLHNTPYTSPVSSRRSSPIAFIDEGIFSFDFADEEKFHCSDMLSMDECSESSHSASPLHFTHAPIAQVYADLKKIAEEPEVEEQSPATDILPSPLEHPPLSDQFEEIPHHPNAINRPRRKRKVVKYKNSFDLPDEPEKLVKSSSSRAVGRKKKSRKRSSAASSAAAQKRDSHNISERQRRKELKQSFNALQDNVPEVANSQRAHTSQILESAISYIRQLEEQETKLRLAKNKLKKQIQQGRAGLN